MITLALSGMDIFKLLPKTNCKDCNSPSCLAFAMKVAAGRALYTECPFVAEDSRAKLEEMMEPPVIEVTLKRENTSAVMGGEKVLFRHDETFYHPTAVGIEIPPDLTDDQLAEKVSAIQGLVFERVGEPLYVNFIALSDPGNPVNPGNSDSGRFASYAHKVFEKTSLPLALRTENPAVVKEILGWPSTEGLLLYTSRTVAEQVTDDLKKAKIILALPAQTREDAVEAGSFFRDKEIKNALIAVDAAEPAQVLDILHYVRIQALAHQNRILGFPTLVWPRTGGGQTPPKKQEQLMEAATAVMKYGSAVVVADTDPDHILPLLVLRQNIFTDPRRPIQVEAKLYSFGDVTPESPVLVTTNFSLTYFTVASEIEASRVPAHLLIVDTEGTSVLTAWSADRFNAVTILKALQSANLENVVSHRNLVLPGYVAMLREDIEETSSWKAIVGPRESSGIPAFLRSTF